MVDRLKRSLENLEPPDCPQCHVEMKWFESKLIKPEPAAVVEHQFVCETCGGTRKRQEKLDETGDKTGGHGRLARPRAGWASAA